MRSTLHDVYILAEVQSWRRIISRILFLFQQTMIIHLGNPSPNSSSDLPGNSWRRAASWLPYLILLHVGFTMPFLSPEKRCALTAPFHPYRTRFRTSGGIFSVALSLESLPVPVRNHIALRSSDFPPESRLEDVHSGDHLTFSNFDHPATSTK